MLQPDIKWPFNHTPFSPSLVSLNQSFCNKIVVFFEQPTGTLRCIPWLKYAFSIVHVFSSIILKKGNYVAVKFVWQI